MNNRGPQREKASWTFGLVLICLGSVLPGNAASQTASFNVAALAVGALGDEYFDPESVAGRPVLMQFWASWCGSCGSIMWELDELLKVHPQTAYLAISTDAEVGSARDYASKHALFEQRRKSFVHDKDTLTAQAFDVTTVPTIILLDAEGNTRLRHLGHLNSADIQTLRKKMALLEAQISANDASK